MLQTHSHQDYVVLVPKQTYKPMEQIREPQIRPRHLWSINFDGGGKKIKWEKDNLFSMWCWENCTASCESMKLGHSFTACTKMSSRWLKDSNIRQDTIKLLEENIGKTFSDK